MHDRVALVVEGVDVGAEHFEHDCEAGASARRDPGGRGESVAQLVAADDVGFERLDRQRPVVVVEFEAHLEGESALEDARGHAGVADRAEQELKRQYLSRSLYGVEVVATVTPLEAAAAAVAGTKAGPAVPELKLETSVQGGKIVNNTEKVDRKVPTNPWVMLAQSMVCSNEFVYLN